LFPAGFTKIILWAVAFFPVPYYVRILTVGAIEFYFDCHSYIVSLFVLTVIPLYHTLWITSKYCICHGDIHAANILISKDDFFIVDWDTLIMAPKERDLMFIGAGIANKWNTEHEAELFYRGYGEYDTVNLSIINYYRYIRIIEDIVVFSEQFFAQNTDEKNQKTIIEIVEKTFLPGNVVEVALRTDHPLFH
jgi:5-methylthioribose kinase